MKKFKKILKYILLGIFVLLLFFAGYLFIGKPQLAKDIIWGVIFSKKQVSILGVDWQGNELALLDDLEVKNLKVAARWD